MPYALEAQKLVYGGKVLGHHDGKAVFVAGGLPGELLEVEPRRRAKGVWQADLLRVLQPSPLRIQAPCPWYGECGGCHYQHMGYDAQLESKQAILLETLRRAGGIHWEGSVKVHAARPVQYRNQAVFKVASRPAGGCKVGFYRAGSHELISPRECLIVSPLLNRIFAQLQQTEWTAPQGSAAAKLAGCAEIELRADEADEAAMMVLWDCAPQLDQPALADALLQAIPPVKTVCFENGGRFTGFGAPDFSYSVGEFAYRVGAGSFFQASRTLVASLVASAMNCAGASGPGNEAPSACGSSAGVAFDLYAGVGLFALPLARVFDHVVAVECNPQAVKDLRYNTRLLGKERLRVVELPVEQFLRRCPRQQPRLALLDPPRTGAEAFALRALAALQPERIHYVSCHPPTLARDLRILTGCGYTIESVEMFDLFPHTFHIESLVKLKKGKPAAA